MDGVEAATSAWAAAECSRIAAQESSEERKMAHADRVRDAKVKELDAWRSFNVSEPIRAGDMKRTAAGNPWDPALKMVEGV